MKIFDLMTKLFGILHLLLDGPMLLPRRGSRLFEMQLLGQGPVGAM